MEFRVAICEDDHFTRSMLEAALNNAGLQVVFSSSTASDTLQKIQALKTVNVVVVDLNLGAGPTGLDLARSIRRQLPDIGFVFLSSLETPELIERDFLGLPTGSQYLLKSDLKSVEVLVEAIRRAAKRAGPNHKASGLASTLTQGQLVVLSKIADGLSNAEIAKELGLSEDTIEGTVRRLAKRLDIQKDPSTNQRVMMARAYLKAIGGLR